MIVFCLSVNHLWGRTPDKNHQDACAVAYADDGYIKAELSVALEVLSVSDIKHSRRTLASTSISTRPGFSSRVCRRLMRTLQHSACSMPIPPSRTSVPCSLPRLLWLTATLALVFIGTDAFIQHFVKDKCQAIMEDVDNIQEGFIHYQLLRFCQATRLQYLYGHVQLTNRNVLQQHVHHKIANALLKKSTRDAYKTWNQQDRAWVDMRLHESHDEGGFGVPNNTITSHKACGILHNQHQVFCLPGHLCLPYLNRSGCRATISGIQPPCASITLARVFRSSASSTCLRSTWPRSRNQLSALK